jgi:hypothetical protein
MNSRGGHDSAMLINSQTVKNCFVKSFIVKEDNLSKGNSVLDEAVNNWLKLNPGINVVDVVYSTNVYYESSEKLKKYYLKEALVLYEPQIPEALKGKEIIDFEVKRSYITFYLGKNGSQFGDDWGTVPYEHNAGLVYSKFVDGAVTVLVPYKLNIYEPRHGYTNSPYSKNDMRSRKIPCVILSEKEYSTFEEAVNDSGLDQIRIFFGNNLFSIDGLEIVTWSIPQSGPVQ